MQIVDLFLWVYSVSKKVKADKVLLLKVQKYQ